VISKIGAKRSGHPGKLVAYLFGPGKLNEHQHQRTVAGTVHYPGAGPEVRAQVTADLQWAQRMWPDTQFPGGHVWHCSLSLAADEGVLSDEKWEAVATDFMREMQLDDPAKAPLRWTAVHHGASAEGNDHVHIVASLIREDGTKANIWQDMVRSQRVLVELEQRHGLRTLQSRLSPVGARVVPYTQGEAVQARVTGRPVERVELEQLVRAASTSALSEVQFVQHLRAAGVRLRPYPPSGAVTGYSAALELAPGRTGRWFQGGELARDLTLPRLRATWPDKGAPASLATAEWRASVLVQPPPTPVAAAPEMVATALAELDELELALSLAGPAELAELSHDVAGGLAAAGRVAAPGEQRMLASASREVGGWAGTRKPVVRQGPTRTQLAALLLLHALNPESEQSRAFMQRQLIEAVVKLFRTHRAVRPVAGMPGGKGVRMSEANDELDGALTDGLTVSVTTGLVLATANQSRVEAARRAAGNFFGRFTREDPAPFQPKPQLPPGYRDAFTETEWARLRPDQRAMLDPDQIGRWPTDIAPDRPETGPTLPATRTQIQMAGALGEELGLSARDLAVSGMTRVDAAREVQRLEARLEPGQVQAIYHDRGLPYRRVGKAGAEFVFPGDVPTPVAAAVPAVPVTPTPAAPSVPAPQSPTPAATAAPAPTPHRSRANVDPLKWRSAKDPVTGPQAGALAREGIPPEEVRKLNKGWAGVVLDAFAVDQETGHDAMDRALAAIETQQASTCRATPVHDPSRQHRPPRRP